MGRIRVGSPGCHAGMSKADSAKLWAMMFRLRGRADACCDLHWSGSSLRRDRSALRGFRSLFPLAKCLKSSNAMQVISLEG
jgi:hypothetical protein